MKEGKVYLAHSYWRFQSIFGWSKAEWNKAESIQFMVAEQQQNGGRGLCSGLGVSGGPEGCIPVLVTLYSLLGQIPDTGNEGREGLFSSQLLEVSVHIQLAQG